MKTPPPTDINKFTRLLALGGLFLSITGSAFATSYTWAPTAAGTTYDWSTPANWTANSGFPNAIGDVANFTNDILGAQTFKITADRTVGILNIGDANGDFKFTMTASNSARLIFDNGSANSQLNGNGTGTVGVSLSAPITIAGNNVLDITPVAVKAIAIDVITASGAAGSQTINKLGTADSNVTINANWTFNGNINLSGGYMATGNGAGKLSAVNQVTISQSGFLSFGDSSSSISVANLPSASSPRLSTGATVIMNGGMMKFSGNFANATTTVVENVGTVNFNSGSAVLDLSSNDATHQYELTFAGMNHAAGAGVLVRLKNANGAAGVFAGPNRYLVAGGMASSLVGDSVDAATSPNAKNLPIIPWASAGGLSTNDPGGDFLTYGSNGFVKVTGYETTATASTTNKSNVSSTSSTITASTNPTYNALKIGSAAAATINLGGNTVTLFSGALSFANNGGLAGNGSVTNGTLNFAREGYIFVGGNSGGSTVGTISANISGTSGFTKFGGGNLILSGTGNTLSGPVYVAGGILRMGVANGLSIDSDVNVANTTTSLAYDAINNSNAGGLAYVATTWDLNGNSQNVRSLSGGGSVGGNVTLGSGTLTLTGVASSNANYAGVISGSGGLIKTGHAASVQTLSGASTYTGGTSVNAGKLLVNNTTGSGTGAGAVSVASGATLGGSGIISGAVTVASGGTLAPGNSPGVISTGSLTLSTGSNYAVEATGTASTPGDLTNGYDQTRVTGTVSLEGANLVLSLSNFTAPNGTLLFIITNDSTDAVIGTFAGLANNATFSQGGQLFQISYFADTANFTTGTFTGGNDVALQVIPEPETWAMMVGGLGMLLGVQRWRRRFNAIE